MIDDLTEGNDLFGLKTSPVKMAYLCNDRSTDDLTRTFERIAPKHSIPRYSLLDAPEFANVHGATSCITMLKTLHPEVDFVVFDPVSTELANGNNPQEVGKFLKSLTILAQKLNITILIVHHTAETKIDAGYASPREKMAGCGAWGGYSNLNMIIAPEAEDDPTNEYRSLHILPRNGANLTIRLIKDDSGCLLVAPEAEDKIPLKERVKSEDDYLYSLPPGRYHRSDFADGLHKKAGALQRVIDRWIDSSKLLRDTERGWYLKV